VEYDDDIFRPNGTWPDHIAFIGILLPFVVLLLWIAPEVIRSIPATIQARRILRHDPEGREWIIRHDEELATKNGQLWILHHERRS
jgi:hypothetical protein